MIKKPPGEDIAHSIRELARLDGFLVSDRGTIAWTPQGLASMRQRFASAGIDIRKLRTIEEYLRARITIEPGFGPFLSRMARGKGAMTDERKLLMAIVDRDSARAAQLRLKLSNRRRRGDRETPED